VSSAGAPTHRIVTGPLAALEPALVEHVFAAKGEDPLRPVVILVGETLLRPYLRRRIAEVGDPHLNVHIVTASELGLRLGEHAMIAAGRRPLPVLADRILAQDAAHSSSGYFDAVSDAPGFAHALHRTLLDLQRAACSPADLAARAPGVDEQEKVLALSRLAARHAELRAGHYDTDEALAAADPGRLGADRLLVYGLWDAPQILRRAIAGIARTRPVTAYLPTAHPVADAAHADLREWLSNELGASTQAAEPPPASGSALAHVGASLAAPPHAPAAGGADGAVRIVSAPDPSREARAALRACLRWAAEGIGFHEIAIAYRHADPYRPLLAALAREAKIPIYDHEGTPLAELPPGRRTLALLDLLENDLDRASVIAFASDEPLPDEARERYAGSAAQWDRLSREAGVVRGIDQWRERLDGARQRLIDRHEHDAEEDPEPPEWVVERKARIEGLKAFVEGLADCIARRPVDAPWSEHVAHLEETFQTYLREAEPVLDAVRSLTRLDGLTATVSGERFLAVVRGVVGGLRQSDVGEGKAGAFRARGVNVIDVSSLRHLRFRAVCVLGLAERSFPPVPRQDPLLLDHEREALGLPPRAWGADAEPLQFALAVHAAGERLLLSHPRTEHGSGRPLIASSFLRAAAEALAGERIAAETLPDRTDAWLERVNAGRVGAPAPDEALDPGEYDRTLLELDPALGIALMKTHRPGAARGRRAWLARLSHGPLTPYEGGLTEAVRADLARHPRRVNPLSPSSLETFADCPMRFFLGRILELSGLEEPEEISQISPLARGSLMHAVMESAMREWLPHERPSPERRDTQLARLTEIALDKCADAERQGLTGYPALWEAERDGILLDLRLWYDEEVKDAGSAGMDAADFEVGFGFDPREGDSPRSTAAALELQVDRHPLFFHGRIDRLEWSEADAGFRVVDYKTGKYRGTGKQVFDGGRALQLPLYLLGAGDVILARDWRDGSAEYFYSTRKGGFKRVVVTGEQLVERREDFDLLVGTFAESIAEGSFPARPGQRKCGWCDFRSLCPAVSDHQAQVDRKSADPRVARLRELEEIE